MAIRLWSLGRSATTAVIFWLLEKLTGHGSKRRRTPTWGNTKLRWIVLLEPKTVVATDGVRVAQWAWAAGNPGLAASALLHDPIERAELKWLRCVLNQGAQGDEATLDELTRVLALSKSEGDVQTQWRVLSELARLERRLAMLEVAERHRMAALALLDAMAMSLPLCHRESFWQQRQRASVRSAERFEHGDVQQQRGLNLLLEILPTLAADDDTLALLERITEGAVQLSLAERGFVLLVDQNGQWVQQTLANATHKVGQELADFSRTIAETVLIDGEKLITLDAQNDPRINGHESVHNLKLRSVACLPIKTSERIVGLLYLEHRARRGRFLKADMQLLEAFAAQAAVAIRTSLMLSEIQAQKESLARANAQLVTDNHGLERTLDDQASELQTTKSELRILRANGGQSNRRWSMIGRSEPMRRVYARLERLVDSDVPVVVVGESGTGKELVARALHREGARHAQSFVALNCGAVSEGLIESELFGHESGAFSGALRRRDGVFVQANGGTLFLDEVESMPQKMQVDLLRVLQEMRVRPIGASKDTSIDVRLIASSQRPLKDAVDEGLFRSDLYYRLAVMEVRLPALREHRDDLPELCQYLLKKIEREQDVPKKQLSWRALNSLAVHPLPGNVRQLEHLLLSAAVITSGGIIDVADLGLKSPTDQKGISSTTSDAPASIQDFKSEERKRILAALNVHDWNKTQAARALGMPRRTLYRRLKEHSITDL